MVKLKINVNLPQLSCTVVLRHFTHVGTVLDVLWTEEELEGTSWEPGWYHGEVQKYDEDDDMLYILYFKDRAVFSLNATGAFSDGIIRAVT